MVQNNDQGYLHPQSKNRGHRSASSIASKVFLSWCCHSWPQPSNRLTLVGRKRLEILRLDVKRQETKDSLSVLNREQTRKEPRDQ